MEKKMQELATLKSAASSHIEIVLVTNYGIRDAFSSDIRADLVFIIFAVYIVAIYCVIVLGACTPINMRSVLAVVGLLSIGLAYAAGNGLS